MAVAKCPICKREVAPRRANPAFPFCSERCKLIDLGKWLGDEYAIPQKPEEDEDERLAFLRGEGEDDG